MDILDYHNQECGGCYYISYSFGSNGLLSNFICTHRLNFGKVVDLYDICHIPPKDFYL